ncbi:MAG: 3-deoxy-D-manno-octulosonic acid transferase [Gammaproteobacteria bacterium]|nr:MAG: 3-deoxy-D-manno-octulosonic acid transferase [Gammaproteobacteria bacterium]
MRPPAAYRLLSAGLGLLLPPLAAGWALAAHWRRRPPPGGARAWLRQRLGDPAPVPPGALWLHAASVGELHTALPLLLALLEAQPDLRALVTTVTPGGAAALARRLPAAFADRVRHRYLPFDYRRAVRGFFARARPRAGLIVETELWPWLYAAAAEADVPLALVNARLSARTLGAPGWLKRAYLGALGALHAVLCRNPEDAAGFRALGADPARIAVVGNLKFAPPPGPPPPPAAPGRRYVLAASTHAGEERLLAAAWGRLARGDRLLVIAPRYPDRGAQLAAELAAAGWRVSRHSRGEDPAAADIHLVDTLGELPAWIAGAEWVFVGGSLVPRGGQNVLEAARLGKAVVTGPHTFNFADEVARLAAAGALVQAADAAALEAACAALLAEPERAAAMGARGAALCQAEADVVDRYRHALAERGLP